MRAGECNQRDSRDSQKEKEEKDERESESESERERARERERERERDNVGWWELRTRRTLALRRFNLITAALTLMPPIPSEDATCRRSLTAATHWSMSSSQSPSTMLKYPVWAAVN